MVYEIVLGRSEEERKRFGLRGAVFIGKHYVRMAQTTTLSSPIYLDISKSHVVLITGKRGSGKSYTLGVIAEGIADLPLEIKQNISVIILDTMGVYWTAKYPNNRDAALLKEWGLEGKPLELVIYTPTGFFNEFKEKGIPTDKPFALKPGELSPEDWFLTFELHPTEPLAVFIEKLILQLQEQMGQDYELRDIMAAVQAEKAVEPYIAEAARNRFEAVSRWGVFSKEGTPIAQLAEAGKVTILDLSCYAAMAEGWRIKNLIVGLVTKKLFIERMSARRAEEFKSIQSAIHFFGTAPAEVKVPLIWLILDEAHEFLPNKGKTAATDSLVTVLREGRQPGIGLILATQQPGKIHTDVMTQSDIIISHRITAKVDVEALGNLLQSYMRQSLDKELDQLPRLSGAALAVDDINERMFPMQIRPRFSWHGGAAPSAIPEKEGLFEF
ncbi:MAG: ATP-binding protein [Candidatus Woesearchaeota archaeon]